MSLDWLHNSMRCNFKPWRPRTKVIFHKSNTPRNNTSERSLLCQQVDILQPNISEARLNIPCIWVQQKYPLTVENWITNCVHWSIISKESLPSFHYLQICPHRLCKIEHTLYFYKPLMSKEKLNKIFNII